MNIKDLYHWKRKFRILKDWNIELVNYDNYTGTCGINNETKYAEIFPWGEGIEEKDYLLHELIHICISHIESRKTYKERRTAEELFVQDLCLLIIPNSTKIIGSIV